MKEAFSILGQSFVASDAMGKLIVLVILLASVYTMYIIIDRVVTMLAIRSGCRRFYRRYTGLSSPLAMALALSDDDEMPLDDVCRAGLQALRGILQKTDSSEALRSLESNCVLPRNLTEAELEKIRSAMSRRMYMKQTEMDKGMTSLSSVITLAPFCGLLGTVWGVMLIFFQMGQAARAEIKDMAPGVSSAMLTTIAGLFVAIPAVLFNNIISRMIDQTCSEMETFIEDFVASLRVQDVK